eukprot:COSAG06_NODE_1607_length_8948_cov_3.854899_11_plen_56_part_00
MCVLWMLLSGAGSPLILGNDPRNMTDEIKALLTNRELISTLSQVRSLRRSHRAVL